MKSQLLWCFPVIIKKEKVKDKCEFLLVCLIKKNKENVTSTYKMVLTLKYPGSKVTLSKTSPIQNSVFWANMVLNKAPSLWDLHPSEGERTENMCLTQSS